MTTLTVTTFMSLDGVMQSPGAPEEDPSEGFDLGGWLPSYADEGFGEQVNAWFEDADAFLLGRKTYQDMVGYWSTFPDMSNPVAAKLNNLPKYVASTTLNKVEWANSTLISGDVPAEVAALKAEPGRALQVHGSAGLVQTLLAHDLVDEFRLFVFPVLLGRGKRLFGTGTVPGALRHVQSKTTGTGLAIHTYQRAGDLKIGSVLDQ